MHIRGALILLVHQKILRMNAVQKLGNSSDSISGTELEGTDSESGLGGSDLEGSDTDRDWEGDGDGVGSSGDDSTSGIARRRRTPAENTKSQEALPQRKKPKHLTSRWKKVIKKSAKKVGRFFLECLVPTDSKVVSQDKPSKKSKNPTETQKNAQKNAQKSHSVGQIINLITADTDRFAWLMPYINLLWSSPLQLVLCFALLAFYIGYAILGGILTMLFSLWLSGVAQRKAQILQKQLMTVKDARLKVQSDLLANVKSVKMYGWERAVAIYLPF